MTKHEVPQISSSKVCDGSLNSFDQQLNISLMKLNALAQKNNLPCISSSTESCSNIVPASCSGPVSCLNSHQSPPVYSPIGFPRNLSNRSSNHIQQVMVIFLFPHYFKESVSCMFCLWKYFIWRSINILILLIITLIAFLKVTHKHYRALIWFLLDKKKSVISFLGLLWQSLCCLIQN